MAAAECLSPDEKGPSRVSGRTAPGGIATAILAGAMIVAPFVALLFRAEAGLAVMAAALIATAFLLREVLAVTAPGARRWVRAAIGVDLALAAICLALVVALIVRQ
jgi:hypothetical protein